VSEILTNEQGVEFEWPCDRRVAHHPHQIEWIESEHGCDGTEEGCAQTCPVPVQMIFDCPGVGAHPTTMIGGQYR
jgi:hypothetical protein